MITNSGKELVAKYLLGQIPAYATHLSIGCGAVPLDSSYSFSPSEISALQSKEAMDFEMTKLPIISKGMVEENGNLKLSFISELPKENRYEITELGIWSAGANNLATNSDSRIIFNFSESWESHDTSISPIPFLDNIGVEGNIDLITAGNPEDYSIFSVASNNITLKNASRIDRNEGARYLNRKIIMRGDSSTITGSAGSWDATGTHIHLNSINFSIQNNSPSDVLKLAFSVVDQTALGTLGVPDTVKILIQFYRNEITDTRGFAKAEIEVDGSEFTNNRYHVASIPISDLITSPDFTASEIRTCRIFVSTIKDSAVSDDYYILLDAFRIDNITTINPLYKMVGYSIVKIDERPIIKFQNTNNYIEFRFSLGLI